ncbi:proteasome subunit [Phaffia rhodozyma]|uniref:Proteasome subunit beta n=1 Tax=Phaffia rhodozyma TaxID=264483 RepID=A0A0F7SQU6_PHARH|nr:proteasome subunit [Phaffia rhodozyma]
MSRFNPYSENGGTILAIAGSNFTIIAGDTRQSEGYSIQTRYAPKVFRLTDTCVIAVNGFAADGKTLVQRVKQRLEWYNHAHAKPMPIKSIARMIQTILYGNRFFPLFAYVILGGVDETDGSGAVYSFDPVGSYEREFCRAAGAAQSLIQPFLDNQIYFKNQTQLPHLPPRTPGQLPLPQVLSIVTDTFTSATERHIEVGDGLEMFVVVTRQVTGENVQSWNDALAGLGQEELREGASIEWLDSLGVVGGRETKCCVVRRELKKD